MADDATHRDVNDGAVGAGQGEALDDLGGRTASGAERDAHADTAGAGSWVPCWPAGRPRRPAARLLPGHRRFMVIALDPRPWPGVPPVMADPAPGARSRSQAADRALPGR